MRLCRLAVLALTHLCACTDDPRRAQPGPGCSGDGCVLTTGTAMGSGSGGGGTSGTGGAGGLGEGDLSGTIGVLLDEAFSKASPYTGACTVTAPAPAGQTVSTPCDADGSFLVEGAVDGWVLLSDATAGATGVLSTYTYQTVPQAGALLPVVDRTPLDAIAATLAGQPLVEDGRAHVALEIVRDGLPLPGVSVVSGLPNAIVAYDTGAPSAYSNQTSATDGAGRILLLDGDPSAAGFDVVLRDPDGMNVIVTVPVRADTVTIGGFEI